MDEWIERWMDRWKNRRTEEHLMSQNASPVLNSFGSVHDSSCHSAETSSSGSESSRDQSQQIINPPDCREPGSEAFEPLAHANEHDHFSTASGRQTHESRRDSRPGL